MIKIEPTGYGDMATSNAIGSNVFDILICLGLPWFLQTAIVSPGSVVRVISKGSTNRIFFYLKKIVMNLVFWSTFRFDIFNAFFAVNNCFPVGSHTFEWLEVRSQVRCCSFGLVLVLHDYRFQ